MSLQASQKGLIKGVKEPGQLPQEAQMSPQWDMVIDPMPHSLLPISNASSNIREKGTGKKLPQMFVRSDNPEAEDSLALGYKTRSDSEYGPAQPFKFVGQPTKYRVDRTPFHCMSIHEHICIEKLTHWDVSAKVLFEKWNKSIKRYVWNSGMPSQMVREVSKVPFNQRSHAQWWAVAEATRYGYLPLANAQAELDVEHVALVNGFHKAVHHDANGIYHIKDITAWLLLKMAEPEEWDIVEWFWWKACNIFSQWGIFSKMMRSLGLKEEDHLVPKQYIVHGEPSQEDLVRHFVHCSIRVTNSNSHLWDFAKTYIEGNEPPIAPNWSDIPRSHLCTSRPLLTSWRKYGPQGASICHTSHSKAASPMCQKPAMSQNVEPLQSRLDHAGQ